MRFQCPFCQGVVAVPNDDMGSDVQCGHCGEIVSVPTSRVATGSVVSDFIIQEELGRGGMGVVYLTHQITLDRPAALKVLAGAYANNPEFVVDFIKEARAAAKLNHPHIVQAYAVGEDEGVYFFAMEHIDGETMKDYMKREGVIKVPFALEVVQQIAEALDYAWKEQRLVHRDIKPDNIMLTRKGRAKLADLGLARVAGDIDDADSDEVMGTPQYISPEHLTGAEMDVRSDIYSLGATLFHLITGRFAFEGRTATDIARKHLEEQLISPKEINPKIPDSVCRIIFKMMAKNANDRYQSAEDLVEDLRLARQGKKPTSATGPTGKVSKPGKQFSLKKSGGSNTGSFKSVTSTGISISSPKGTLKKSISSPKAAIKKSISSPKAAIKKSMSATGTNSKMDKKQSKLEREKKAKRQMIIMLVVLFCFILAGVLFLVLSIAKKSTPKRTAARGHSSQQVINDKYMKDAEKMRNFVKNNFGKNEEILKEFERFFNEHRTLSSKADEDKRAELLGIYIPLDERRVKVLRENARRAHIAILQARKDAMESKENDNNNQQEQARIDQKQKRLKELEERKKQIELERQQKKRKRIQEYVEAREKDKQRVRYLSLFYSVQHKYKDAENEFISATKEESRAPELYKKEAAEFTAWGNKMLEHVRTAAKMWDAVANSGDTLKGMQVEITPGILAKIQVIKNGNITALTMDKKSITKSASKLPFKQLKRVFLKIEGKLLSGQKDAFFHYLFCDAQFVHAKEFMPNGWADEWKASAQEYANKKFAALQKLDDPAERKKELYILFKGVGKAIYFNAKKAVE